MLYPEKRKRIGIVILIVLMPILIILYRFLDPESVTFGRFFPKCPVKLLTGLDCPSCGVQRALHSLLTGDIIGALHYNLFIPFSLLYLLGMWITYCLCSTESAWRRYFWGMKGGLTYIIFYLVWFVVRNLLGI